jgi:hypothetical protein
MQQEHLPLCASLIFQNKPTTAAIHHTHTEHHDLDKVDLGHMTRKKNKGFRIIGIHDIHHLHITFVVSVIYIHHFKSITHHTLTSRPSLNPSQLIFHLCQFSSTIVLGQ